MRELLLFVLKPLVALIVGLLLVIPLYKFADLLHISDKGTIYFLVGGASIALTSIQTVRYWQMVKTKGAAPENHIVRTIGLGIIGLIFIAISLFV